jgi:hypothetical protein
VSSLSAKARQSTGTPANKRVSFGPYISPEYIDKHLPPSSPVRKGASVPANGITPVKAASAVSAAAAARINGTPSSLLKQSLKRATMDKRRSVSEMS